MQSRANQTDFDAVVDPAVEELIRIVKQAESLLRSLGDGGGEAVDAVRDRVTETLHQAKARLAETAVEAEAAVEGIAERTDSFVRQNPWQSVAAAALLGGVVAYLLMRNPQE
jgi:ElaB/YqjD/DUF883 family membrane-anchored ribosome-binding protein